MGVKISALPVAAEVGNAAIIPIVQAGVTEQCTRTQFLTAKVGEILALFGDAGDAINFQIGGGIAIASAVGGVVQIQDGGGGIIAFDGIGNILVGPALGAGFQLLVGTASFVITGANAVTIVDTSGASAFVTYVAVVPGNWAGAPPVDMATAIDRLVAVVAVLNGAPV